MAHYTESIVEKTRSEKENQLEGVKRAFNLAIDEYAEKYNGDLPDLTESSVINFVRVRPELNRALENCHLVGKNEWARIALEVMQERISTAKSNNIAE